MDILTTTDSSSIKSFLVRFLGIGLLGVSVLFSGVGCGLLGGDNEDTTPPSAPEQVELESGDEEVDVRWNSVEADDLEGYVVRRSRANSNAVASLTPSDGLFTETSITDSDVLNGTTYTYWVIAVDKKGNRSEPSSKKEIRPFASPPDGP